MFHCKCHHHLIVNTIIAHLYISSVYSLLNHCFCLLTFNFIITHSRVMCHSLGLRAFNHTLPDGCIRAHTFTIYFCYSLQAVFLSSAFWGWSCLAPLSSIGIQLGLLYIGRGVATGPNVLRSTPFPTQESTFGVTSREFPWMLKNVVLSKHILQSAKCILLCTPPEGVV